MLIVSILILVAIDGICMRMHRVVIRPPISTLRADDCTSMIVICMTYLWSIHDIHSSPQTGVVGRCVLGGANNHIKAFKLHLLHDQRELLTEGPYNVVWSCWQFVLSCLDHV